jgi:hypothetical protein
VLIAAAAVLVVVLVVLLQPLFAEFARGFAAGVDSARQ